LQKADVARPEDFPNAPPLHELLAEIPAPRRKEYTLDNGLRVVVLPNDEVPFVSAMLGLKNGPWTEDPDMPGVASMALALLTKGTENYSADELAEKVERNALTLSGRAGASGASEMDVGSVSATALADKTELALELMAEVVRRPTFPEDEVEVFRKQRMLQLKIREEDPRHIAMRELRRRVFGDHPYARYAAGELADVRRVQRGDVAAWWQANARPENAVLYVAGDVKPGKARKWAQAAFADWTAQEPARDRTYPPIPAREATHIYLVDHPGAVQSQIRLGQTSLTRTDPGYFVSRVYTQILGGGFNSRINRVIRIERGLTYGAWGYIEPQMDAGFFSCGTFTKTESTAEALKGVLEVIDSMQSDPPAGAELAEAKSYLVGSFPRGLETPRAVMTQQWIIDAYGLPEDYLQQAMDAYNAVETADLESLAAERIDPEKLTVVVVGDAETLEEPLAAIAPVTVVKDAMTQTAAME
jgi:zinc protease